MTRAMGIIGEQQVTKPLLYKQFLEKWLNLRGVALVVALGVVVVSVASYVDSVSKLVAAMPSREPLTANFDTTTQEKTLAVAKEIDRLCSHLSDEPKSPYAPYKETYRDIGIELRNLVLRQESRPLNDLSAKQQQLVLKNFERLRDYHRSKGKVSAAFSTEACRLFNDMFSIILSLEASKQKAAER